VPRKGTYVSAAEKRAVAKHERKHKELTERYEAAKADGDHATALKWNDRIDRLERAEEKRQKAAAPKEVEAANNDEHWDGRSGEPPQWWQDSPFFEDESTPEIKAYSEFCGEWPLVRSEHERLAEAALASVGDSLEQFRKRAKEHRAEKK
jgi:hypothetical protein